MTSWDVAALEPGAVGVSASRRTDIPALYAPWFEQRLAAGFAEYIPAGPPRRVRVSLRPEHVTHFTFWSKWPRPFFRALDRVLAAGYPVLWNVTLSGLGGTPVEPHVPPPAKVVAATEALARRVPPAAILWRYDPVFVSTRHDVAHHVETFARLLERLAAAVDRVVVSFVAPYGRRVTPDLGRYHAETGDDPAPLGDAGELLLATRLSELAAGADLPFAVCCQPALRAALGAPPGGCNRWSWATRAYPTLAAHPALADRPLRADCACSREVDIGVYDTCTLGCRYSYGSADVARARARHARHDPTAPCLTP